MDLFPRGRLHPLVIVAAGSLIIVSGVGIAGLAGVLPGSKAATATPAKAKKAACTNCGTVLEVKEVEVKGRGTGLGVAVGAVAGGVVGHQVGDGKPVGTVVGAVGGGVLGHHVERDARAHKRYDVSVRMADGSVKIISSGEQPAWRSGDRVRVRDGRLGPA